MLTLRALLVPGYLACVVTSQGWLGDRARVGMCSARTCAVGPEMSYFYR